MSPGLELGAQNDDSESRLNGNPSVALAIYLAPGANAVNTAKRGQQTSSMSLAAAVFRRG